MTVQEATLGTPAHDDPGMAEPWTEDAMLRTLWRHFAAQSWAAVPQVTVAQHDLTPHDTRRSQWDSKRLHVQETGDLSGLTDRRIDLLAMRRPTKTNVGPLETLAVEVKVTRADFMRDTSEKRAPWMRAATRFAYAVPAGLVTADEVPPGCGLLAVKHAGSDGWGTAEWVKKAPYADGHAPQLPPRVILAVMWRIATLEAHTRGWNTGPAAAGTPQELRAALQAANKAAERAERAREKAEGQRDAWKDAYALLSKDGHPCQWCGQPVKPLNPGPQGFRKWRHRDQADDEPCTLAETLALEDQARADYAAADPTEQGYRLANAHRYHPDGFDAAAEAEPWRAFLPLDFHKPRRLILRGAQPADVLPEGINA